MKKVAGIVLLVLLLTGGYIYVESLSQTFSPPVNNLCFDMLQSNLEVARAKENIIVPMFSFDTVQSIRCKAAPGIITFQITGIDIQGNAFNIMQSAGGRAASGADTLYDYCYIKDGTIVSQTRSTGREGLKMNSACKFDPAIVTSPISSYSYDRS